MQADITKIARPVKDQNIVFLVKEVSEIPKGYLSPGEIQFITNKRKKDKQDFFSFNRLGYWLFIQYIKATDEPVKRNEKCRKAGDSLATFLNEQKAMQIVILDSGNDPEEILAYAEGIALGNYQFLKYKTIKKKKNTLVQISICHKKVSEKEVEQLSVLTEAVFHCRDMINEPNTFMTAVAFSNEVEKVATPAGIKVEIMNKGKIESLKMGGLLGVNKGSHEPPTFTVLEWLPENPVNKKPYVFVGKGVVFDTGGMNLKPGDFMNNMKVDMAGAAAVASAIFAIAKSKLPVHVIGLMPATDNRPGPEAIVSGDILKMHNGMTVEVINTDAEGRLILADALSYAKKFDPALVIDLATLTGAASRAIGKFGLVAMQAKAEKELQKLKIAGWNTYERIVEFPNWDEYGEGIKSDIADLKNMGPAEAGAITAGKFLEKFTEYPYIHLDIAGPALLEKRDSYRGSGGTGVGVRLLFNFVKNL
jgi:leucyl aminopeptidase